jgi:hypothetical protein
MPSIEILLLSMMLIGVAASGLTHVLMTLGRQWMRTVPDPQWWQALGHLVPILIGVGAGMLCFAMPWSLLIGVASGTLSAMLYRKAVATISQAKIAGVQTTLPQLDEPDA